MGGGGSFGYGQSRSNNRSDQWIWGEQTPYLKDLYKQASGLTGQNTVAGFDPYQTQGQNMAAQYAAGQGTGIANQTAGALNFGLNAADVTQNPYLQKAMQSSIRPLTQNFQENVLPGIGNQAVQAGQYGGSRQGIAEGIASRGYLNAVGDVVSGMGSQAYGQGLNTMMQSINSAPSVQGMGMFGSNVMQGIGAQRQGLAQQSLDNPWLNMSRYGNVLGGPATLGSSQGGSRAYNISMAGQASGGGG